MNCVIIISSQSLLHAACIIKSNCASSPRSNTATSFASLSSIEEDNSSWDLTCDPHVTRNTTTRPSRTHSHTHFADDESSDTSVTGISEGCAVQGTFPSAEHIRIRWAKPIKNLNIAGEENGRRRVGVETVKGEMTCIVRGRALAPLIQRYREFFFKWSTKGNAKGSGPLELRSCWDWMWALKLKVLTFTGQKAFPLIGKFLGARAIPALTTGRAAAPIEPNSRTSSIDSNGPRSLLTPSIGHESTAFLTARTNSASSSTSSLLRAPLPAQNVADYSFEGSHTTLPSSSETLSSISSLPTSSTPILPLTSEARLPGHPVTLHLNMNDLQPPAKNVFTFKITGTILVTARATLARANNLNASMNSDTNGDPDPVALPRFTVLAADSETTAIIVRSEAESASVEVFHPTGDIYNDPQTRKTVLQKGGFTKCGEDGGRIGIKTLDAFNMATNARISARPRTPSAIHRASSNSSLPRATLPPRSKQANATVLPWVKATVTALAPGADMFPTGYARQVMLSITSFRGLGMARFWHGATMEI